MATITRQDLDAVNTVLTVTVSKDDYYGEFDKTLKRYQREAGLKGFRKGKTPMSVVRKMFGRQLLFDAVNKELERSLGEYLYNKETPIDFLGQPIPSEEQETMDFNTSTPGDFVFKFDLGLAPNVELGDFSDAPPLKKYVVRTTDEEAEEKLEEARARYSKPTEVEGVVEERDIIKLKGVELLEGQPKEDGVECEFTLFIGSTTPAVQEAFMGKPAGTSAVLNIFDLEPGTSEEHVYKYIMQLEEDDPRVIEEDFEMTLLSISRQQPAEFGTEFYQDAFGPDTTVSSKEEALATIKELLDEGQESTMNALFFREIQDYMIGHYQMEFPETFLKRWLVLSNERNTEESVEAGFEGFKKGLGWMVLRNKLIERYGLEVTNQEVRQAMAQEVAGYFGGEMQPWMTEDFIDSMVDRMLKEKGAAEAKYDALMNEKLSNVVCPLFPADEQVITPDELEDIVAAINAENAASEIYFDEEE